MQQQGYRSSSAIALGNTAPPRSTGSSKSAKRLTSGRVTARRDPADSDQARMIRIMMEAVEKMMNRLGILAPETLQAS